MSKKLVNTFIKTTDTIRELIVIYALVLVTSAVLFSIFEHKSLFDSIWWASVTAMTIGYGDLYPVTVGGRLVAMALMHIVPLIIIPLVIVRLLDNVVVDKNVFTHQEQEELKQTLKQIKQSIKA